MNKEEGNHLLICTDLPHSTCQIRGGFGVNVAELSLIY